MANSYFSFKQFTIQQEKCAMKVGTDGVLLGAWANASQPKRILDIGTGTGLVALMLAQRFSGAMIEAVELDEEAAIQAKQNISNSPWKSRVEVLHVDFLRLETDQLFDLVVTNPPYFENSLKTPSQNRTIARHTDSMPLEDLFDKAASLLTPEGTFALVLPADAYKRVCELASSRGLYLKEVVWVKTTPRKAAKRILVNFVRRNVVHSESDLIIELERHKYSDEYVQLVKDFYLAL